MYCPKCYRLNDDERTTCINCGATLRKKPMISADKVISTIKTEVEKTGVVDQLKGIKEGAEKHIAAERAKKNDAPAEAAPVPADNTQEPLRQDAASVAEKIADPAPAVQSVPGDSRIPQKLLDFDAQKKRLLTLVILALGVVMMVAGLMILCQNGVSHTGRNGGLVRASTSIEFGADFYTTSAQATALAANAVTDLYKLGSVATGIFFMFVGGVEICVTLLLTDIKELFGKQGK